MCCPKITNYKGFTLGNEIVYLTLLFATLVWRFSHLHILQKGSNVEERHMDRSIELGLSCVQQLFKG